VLVSLGFTNKKHFTKMDPIERISLKHNISEHIVRHVLAQHRKHGRHGEGIDEKIDVFDSFGSTVDNLLDEAAPVIEVFEEVGETGNEISPVNRGRNAGELLGGVIEKL
jgi:hypothetical protein